MSIAGLCLLWQCCFGQGSVQWQELVRSYSQKGDWGAAMLVIDQRAITRPDDPEVMAWRARVLLWSGRPDDSEREWLRVLSLAPRDPDNWIGLSAAYLRQSRPEQALPAIDKAVELDPRRADTHFMRGRTLLVLKRTDDGAEEFRKALGIDPYNEEAKRALIALRSPAKNQLLITSNTDLSSFTSPYQQNEAKLSRELNSHIKVGALAGFYRRAGVDSGKFGLSLTSRAPRWGALNFGGTMAHDSGVIPRNETWFEYDRGWRLSADLPVRGLEVIYGQHWYWYATARVLTISETAILCFPRNWTWSAGLSGARSGFAGAGPSWTPSETTKLGFPIYETKLAFLVETSSSLSVLRISLR
jgi:tetratricopeptide (TPR) repeat protein